MSEMIETENLVKRYGSTLAVDRISFSVGRSEIVGFLGPNGAGKSTTMKILTGFLKPTAGDARVCGYSVRTHILNVQQNIGYLPESAPAYQDMEVGAYLKFIASMRGMWPKEAKSAIDRVLDVTGLRPRWRFPIDTLSRGYKQRVGLAAAMLHDPDVLILDEPTSGLDPVQIVDIRDVIREIGQEKTVIFSTHIMQEVEAICNRVIIIDRGRLLADGDFGTVREQAYDTVDFSLSIAGDLDPIRQAVLQVSKHATFHPPDRDARRTGTAAPQNAEFQDVTLTVPRSDSPKISDSLRKLAASDSTGLRMWKPVEPSLEALFRHIVARNRAENSVAVEPDTAGDAAERENEGPADSGVASPPESASGSNSDSEKNRDEVETASETVGNQPSNPSAENENSETSSGGNTQ